MTKTRSFPLIHELPQLMDSSDWVWLKPPLQEDQMGIKAEWWIGTDSEGRNWLVKMRNGFFAYREHVFSSIAQRLGISCQSSTFVLIESELSEPRLHTEYSEPYQLAIWMMNEHPGEACSTTCPWSKYWEAHRDRDYFKIIHAGCDGISYFDDLIRGDVLGYLCGQFEPHDHFLTSQHEYVVIDAELMFSLMPGLKPSLKGCRWLEFHEARPLIAQVCRDLVSISDQELLEIAKAPESYIILNGRNLYDDLLDAKAAAGEYLHEVKRMK